MSQTMSETGLLIIEDDADDLQMLVRSAEEHGFIEDLRIARDGEEGLAALARAPLPKLITLDLNLPRVSGLEILRVAKSNRQTCHIPIVIVSSSSADRDVERAYELGASSYVIKPQDYSRYGQVMGDLLRFWLVINLPPKAGICVKTAAGLIKGRSAREWPNA